MTPFSARLYVTAFLLLGFVIAVNALLLQPAKRTPETPPQAAIRPSASVSVQSAPLAPLAAGTPARASTEDSAPGIPQPQPDFGEDRLSAAVFRELSRKGYAAKPGQNAAKSLRAMILAYEFDSRLPLSGAPSENLLKRLLFDLDRAPRGAFADRAETDQRLVLAIQKSLLQLGFFSGTLTGRMDEWTQSAISAYERHRKLPVTSRLDETTLLDLIAYSGAPIARADLGN
jgi:hypothetical protein